MENFLRLCFYAKISTGAFVKQAGGCILIWKQIDRTNIWEIRWCYVTKDGDFHCWYSDRITEEVIENYFDIYTIEADYLSCANQSGRNRGHADKAVCNTQVYLELLMDNLSV
jgi:hypothetical protein